MISIQEQQKNKYMVFNALLHEGGKTRYQLSKKTNLSRPTISRIIKRLIEDKLVIENKKNMMLVVNENVDHVLAIDLGGTKIRFSIFSLGLQQIMTKTVATYSVEDRQKFIICLIKDIQKVILISECHSKLCSIISIASAGVVDNILGKIICGASNLPQWENFNLSKELALTFSIPILVDNNVKMALLGELYAGKCKGISNAMLICLDAGIGSASLIDGKVLRGHLNMAGEIGFMFVTREQLNSNWRLNPPLESYCSFSGVAKRYEYLTGKKIKGREVFELCDKGDLTAKSFIDEFSDYLAMSILNTMTVTDPEKIIIYGGVCDFSHLFLERTQNIINRHTLGRVKLEIECSLMGDVSSLLGAAILGLSLKYPMIEFIRATKR